MKCLAFVAGTGIDKGAGTYKALFLGRKLQNDGIQVHLLVTSHAHDREIYSNEYHGVRIHYCDGKPLGILSKIRKLFELRPDVVHCLDAAHKSSIPSFVYRLLFRQSKLIMDYNEYLSHTYTDFRRISIRMLELASFRVGDVFLVVSDYLKKTFGRYIPSDKLYYFPIAVDISFFEESKLDWVMLRNSFGKRPLIVYVGTFQPQYDAHRVIEVAEVVVRERKDVLFLLVGDGPLRIDMQNYVNKHGLSENVHFLGFVPHREIPKYLCAADVLLFPIRDSIVNRARCPTKAFEYLASHRPIVTNPVGEVETLLGPVAYFFDYDSLFDFKDKILEAIEKGPRLAEKDIDNLIEKNNWERRYRVYKKITEALVEG